MQNTNLAVALDAQTDTAAQEMLRDELAQFISEELIENPAAPKPALTVVKRRLSLWSGNPMETRLSRRRIHLDNGMFTAFRVR
jgi:hypothetical protein